MEQQPSLLTDQHLRLVVQQCADALTSRLLEKAGEQTARLQKFAGEQQGLAAKAEADLDKARTELAGVKNEIEALRRQKNDAEEEIAALSKRRTDLQADVEKLEEADKRYRKTVETELKRFQERAG